MHIFLSVSQSNLVFSFTQILCVKKVQGEWEYWSSCVSVDLLRCCIDTREMIYFLVFPGECLCKQEDWVLLGLLQLSANRQWKRCDGHKDINWSMMPCWIVFVFWVLSVPAIKGKLAYCCQSNSTVVEQNLNWGKKWKTKHFKTLSLLVLYNM